MSVQVSKFLFFVFVLLFSGKNHVIQNSGTIRIIIYGLRNNTGQIGLSIFDKAGGFPSDEKKVLKYILVYPTNHQAIVEVPEFAYGEYAIAVIHDENNNNKFDTNFFGYPQEGFGSSNNPKFIFGPPSYDSSKFLFNQAGFTIWIEMKYF